MNLPDERYEEKISALGKIRLFDANFNEQKMLEYTNNIIPVIYNYINNDNDIIKKYCSAELIQKMKENKQTYRITKHMDNLRVAFSEIINAEITENDLYVKVYASVFFYDDIDNNINPENNSYYYDRFWNDIWIVTFKKNNEEGVINKCPNCGALMNFNQKEGMFTCNYCRNSIYYSRIDWRITDIEVKK